MSDAQGSRLGDGDWMYLPQPDWARLPPDVRLGDVAGIAVDSTDRVYLFNRGTHPVVVLKQDGSFVGSWGEGIFTNPHGAAIGADDSIFLTDNGDHTVRKFSLDGELQLQIGVPGHPSPFMSGHPLCRCTHSALAPNGDILVSDGYGNARVHRYDADGNLLKSWGEPGVRPGEFNVPHNIACDQDGWIYVADRENHRIQVFDQDGNYDRQVVNIHRPSGFAIGGGGEPVLLVGELASYLAVNREVPDIGPRVSILSNDGGPLARIDRGDGPGTEPGQFISPHSIALDSRRDLYVGEVAATDWDEVLPGRRRPSNVRGFQKFVREVR